MYAWTLKIPGHRDVARVTSWAALDEYARLTNLTGYTPGQFISAGKQPDQGSFTYRDGETVLWTVTWNKATR